MVDKLTKLVVIIIFIFLPSHVATYTLKIICIKRLEIIIILSHHPLAHTPHPFNFLTMCSSSIDKTLTVVDSSVSVPVALR